MKPGNWRITAWLASFLFVAGLSTIGTGAGPSQSPVKPGQTKQEAGPTQSNEQAPKAQAKLSPALAELRERVRRALAFYASRPAFNTRENTVNEILHYCLAFGAEAQVAYDGPSGTKANALGCLCWNVPCSGYYLLQIGDGRVSARIGYGFQDAPSQFLAILAQSHVPADYEIRVGQQRKSVADLAESEKLACRAGTDMSWTLVGLSYYLAPDAAWQTPTGESWSLERILEEELERKASAAECQTTNRLMGISYAVQRRTRQDQPLTGEYGRAQKHVADSQEFALQIANADGSWNPRFFAAKGTSSDAAGSLRATGHIFEWLAFSLPDDRLEDPAVVKSIAYLAGAVENWQQATSIGSLSPRDIASLMHALHALAIYDQRVFKPHDAAKPPAASEKPESKNGKPAGAAKGARHGPSANAS